MKNFLLNIRFYLVVAFLRLTEGVTPTPTRQAGVMLLMASIKLANFIVAVRGKIAGTVYSQNAGGTFARQYVVPTNPQTTPQTNQRALMSSLSAQWKGLTQVQRDAWITTASEFPYQNRVGESKIYTGQQLFVKLNMSILSIDNTATLIEVPPLKPTFPVMSLAFTTLTNVAGTMTVTLTQAVVIAGDATTNFKIALYATPGLSPGVERPSETAFRLIGAFAAETSPMVAGSAYSAVLGEAPIGTKVFVRAEIVHETSGVRELMAMTFKLVS